MYSGTIFLFAAKILFIFETQSSRDRDLPVMVARAGPCWSEEAGASSRSPKWGPRWLAPFPLLFAVHRSCTGGREARTGTGAYTGGQHCMWQLHPLRHITLVATESSDQEISLHQSKWKFHFRKILPWVTVVQTEASVSQVTYNQECTMFQFYEYTYILTYTYAGDWENSNTSLHLLLN